eukprot:TRINITY_DN24820_c0_g1_i1.p1 TRINITY_DN24820_c0_g1~~TRINITY_DN24820_c0_g1_i1.p1  ORF type:complete len:204 (-),score=60.19 TRINITY_DN24820_c0_g1_i1:210-821(-)
MATATATADAGTGVTAPKDVKYERIVLEIPPDMSAEMEEAKELLDEALCSIPSEEDEKYEEEGEDFNADLKKVHEFSKNLLPKGFPYTACLPEDDEEILDKQIFKNYTGAVYWNDCGRDFIIDPNQPKENFQPENMANLVYHSLKPIMIHPGGEKPLTVKGLCEGVTKLKFNPGECHFLENIDIQLREIDDKEVATIVFYTGA